MGLLQSLENGPEYLKAGFLGFTASGKTRTSTLLSIGIRNFFDLKGPIAFFDTEGGVDYVKDTIKKLTGQYPVGIKSRSFDDLIQVGKECEKDKVSVLIVDSITHIWKELINALMVSVNEKRKKFGKQIKTRMSLPEIMQAKELWSPWPDFFLNSKLHIIICGRAGFEWDNKENEETGETELVKTGVKMKVETDFGFEPSLLVEMERVQIEMNGGSCLLNQARVMKDRFGILNGSIAKFRSINVSDADKDKKELDEVMKFFKPYLERLMRGQHTEIDTTIKTKVDVDDDGNAAWTKEKKDRQIFCEEIQGEITKHYPGQTTEEKKAKADLIEEIFGTRSWTKIETTDSAMLLEGLKKIREKFNTKETANA